MKVLLLVRTVGFGLSVQHCLAPLGIECRVFGHGDMKAIRFSRYCRDYVSLDLSDNESARTVVLEKINEYCRKFAIDVIIPTDCTTGYILSRIRGGLMAGLKTFPLADTRTLEILDDKREFERLLTAHGIPQPKTFHVMNAQDMEAVNLPFPRVVKPARGAGRWAVGGSAADYIKTDMDAYRASAQMPDALPAVVQEFIPGYDIDLSILAWRGQIVAWTIQKWISSERFEFVRHDEILRLGSRLVEAIGFEGVAHFDMRIDDRDGAVKFIECNPRFWGSLRASMWNGVNFAELGLKLLGGEDLPAMESRNIAYVLPSAVLKRLKKGEFGVLRGLPWATWRDLGQIVGDPLSCLVSLGRG